jgi:hypothetical protein
LRLLQGFRKRRAAHVRTGGRLPRRPIRTRRQGQLVRPGAEPTLVLNPDDDEQFAAAALGLVMQGARTASRLQAALRRTYPAALVRRRELSGEAIEVWYVYREGHWIPPGRMERDAET